MKNALYKITVVLILMTAAACSPPAQPVEIPPTAVPPTAVPPTAVPPTAAPPTAEPTTAPAQPTTAEAPTVTATVPVAATPAETTAAATPPSGLGFLPQEGLWGGGDRELILSFVIGRQGSQATIQDIGLLWFGSTDDCTLNHLLTDVTPIDSAEFTRTMVLSDMRYVLTGKIISAVEIRGTLDLSYKGCASKVFVWRAIPKITAP